MSDEGKSGKENQCSSSPHPIRERWLNTYLRFAPQYPEPERPAVRKHLPHPINVWLRLYPTPQNEGSHNDSIRSSGENVQSPYPGRSLKFGSLKRETSTVRRPHFRVEDGIITPAAVVPASGPEESGRMRKFITSVGRKIRDYATRMTPCNLSRDEHMLDQLPPQPKESFSKPSLNTHPFLASDTLDLSDLKSSNDSDATSVWGKSDPIPVPDSPDSSEEGPQRRVPSPAKQTKTEHEDRDRPASSTTALLETTRESDHFYSDGEYPDNVPSQKAEMCASTQLDPSSHTLYQIRTVQPVDIEVSCGEQGTINTVISFETSRSNHDDEDK